MSIVVTGAAGFIGSNNVKALNERGFTDILAVDDLSHSEKFRNLVDCEIADYLDKRDFIELVRCAQVCRDPTSYSIKAPARTRWKLMAATCSITTIDIRSSCYVGVSRRRVPFIYASSAAVYGFGPEFVDDRRHQETAERLWIFEVPVRPDRATRVAEVISAGHRSALLQRVRAARIAQGADGFGCFPSLPTISRRRQSQAV